MTNKDEWAIVPRVATNEQKEAMKGKLESWITEFDENTGVAVIKGHSVAYQAALKAAPPHNFTIVDNEELAELKSWVVAFGISHSVYYAMQHGLPNGAIYQSHYDILKKCGARMDDFTPYNPSSPKE